MRLKTLNSVPLAACLVGVIAAGSQGENAAPDKSPSAPAVHVVVAKHAPQLDRLAAGELAGQFRRLFRANVTVTDVPPAGKMPRVIVGSPKTNAAVAKVLLGRKLKTQSIVLKSIVQDGRPTLIVAGGSPAATLWAVYELGYRFGIRYLLRHDIDPGQTLPLKLDGFDVAIEPQFRTRTWEMTFGLPTGPASWPLADQKRKLRQLAKLKFNRVIIAVQPSQPFVHYEFQGVKKQTGVLWQGQRFDIPRDAPGKKSFGLKPALENPDFAGTKNYAERTAAGVKHLRGIIDEAHRLGMTVGLSISPLEFPSEFAKVLSGANTVVGGNNLVIAPGKKQRHDDAVLQALVATKIRAYLKTYPTVDAVLLRLPTSAEWDAHAAAAWKELRKPFLSKIPKLEYLLGLAQKRSLTSTGRQGARSLKGNVVALAFLNRLLRDRSILKRADGRVVPSVVASLDPEFYAFARAVLPTTAVLCDLDNTPQRLARNRNYLAVLPAKTVSCGLVLPLADDHVGVLPQSHTRRLESLVREIRKLGWDGFATRCSIPPEVDPSLHYLSRAAWDAKVTARSAHDELFTTITGKQSISDRLWLAFGHIEAATETIDRNDPAFAQPSPGMLMKHGRAEPAPKWWADVEKHYTQAMIELYRSRGPAALRSQPLLFYYAKRGEYVLDYLKAVKEVRSAALARKQGNKEQATEHLETATEAMYNAITTISDVVRDESDRGLIAVLNKYAYGPLAADARKLAE